MVVLRRLAGYLARPNPSAHLSAIRLNINHVLLGLLETLRAGKASPHQRNIPSLHAVNEFLRRLKSNPALLSETWTLESMAKNCGVGTTTLTAHCHAVTNTTPMDYLNLCRLSWAAEQLKQSPHVSITTIAIDVGFSSSAYFATRFREHYGQSPNAYRQKALLMPMP